MVMKTIFGTHRAKFNQLDKDRSRHWFREACYGKYASERPKVMTLRQHDVIMSYVDQSAYPEKFKVEF
jgi:hypothetical protein